MVFAPGHRMGSMAYLHFTTNSTIGPSGSTLVVRNLCRQRCECILERIYPIPVSNPGARLLGSDICAPEMDHLPPGCNLLMADGNEGDGYARPLLAPGNLAHAIWKRTNWRDAKDVHASSWIRAERSIRFHRDLILRIHLSGIFNPPSCLMFRYSLRFAG